VKQQKAQIYNEAHIMIILLIAVLLFVQFSCKPKEDLFKSYVQLMERGGIPAVFDPQYVPAEEAEIDPETWVLGVVIEGQARAYSLNLLNHHEVVNDAIGETQFAAVW
jgi:hypothetical protein